MKAILITSNYHDCTDADLVLEDGSYAFFWKADGLIKVDLHQGRITRKLNDDDEINDVIFEDCDKMYYEEYNSEEITDAIINETIGWLAMGVDLRDVDLIKVNTNDENSFEIINTFLNLK